MKRWILRILGTVLVLALIAAAYTWVQVRRVRGRLAVEAPLSIEAPIPDRRQLRALQERLSDETRESGGVMRLSSVDATSLLRSALKQRDLIGTLRVERQRLVEALAQIPDPLGLIGDLHLDHVDLKKLDGDVSYTGDHVVARFTGPYAEGPQAGKHLNLLVEASGAWRRGQTPTFKLHRLEVGGLDVLGIVPYGGIIRGQVEAAITQRTERTRLGPLMAISIEGGQGVLTLAPDAQLPTPQRRLVMPPPGGAMPAPLGEPGDTAPAPLEAPAPLDVPDLDAPTGAQAQ